MNFQKKTATPWIAIESVLALVIDRSEVEKVDEAAPEDACRAPRFGVRVIDPFPLPLASSFQRSRPVLPLGAI